MKILNLYAGLGGNRKLWNGEITAIESNEKIAAVYKRLYPTDNTIITDAHEFLRENYDQFDFIWSSPPCQSHSKMNKATRHKSRRFPDMKLYEEILFLKHFFAGKWVVENVQAYYEPLLKPTIAIGRHLFWSNFNFPEFEIYTPTNFINLCDLNGKQALMKWLGIYYEENIYYEGNHCPAQVLRNCVHPLLGQHIITYAENGLPQRVS